MNSSTVTAVTPALCRGPPCHSDYAKLLAINRPPAAGAAPLAQTSARAEQWTPAQGQGDDKQGGKRTRVRTLFLTQRTTLATCRTVIRTTACAAARADDGHGASSDAASRSTGAEPSGKGYPHKHTGPDSADLGSFRRRKGSSHQRPRDAPRGERSVSCLDQREVSTRLLGKPQSRRAPGAPWQNAPVDFLSSTRSAAHVRPAFRRASLPANVPQALRAKALSTPCRRSLPSRENAARTWRSPRAVPPRDRRLGAAPS